MAPTLEISGFGESIEDLEEARKILKASYKKSSKAKKTNNFDTPKQKSKKRKCSDDEAKGANVDDGGSNSTADIDIDTLVNQMLGDSLANSTKKAELDELLEKIHSNSASFLNLEETITEQQTVEEENVPAENTEAYSLGMHDFERYHIQDGVDGTNYQFPPSSTFYSDQNFGCNNESNQDDGIDMRSFLESYSTIEPRRNEEKREKKYQENSAISRKIMQRTYDIIHEKWSSSREK